LACIKQKIDFFEEIQLMGFEILIPKQVIKEVFKIAFSKPGTKKMHFREDAKLALKLIEKNKSEFNEIELIGTNVDNSIVDFAEKNKEDIIATLDREIKNKVRNKKLIIRGKKKLEIV